MSVVEVDDYYVISQDNIDKFNDVVSRRLSEGWVLYGETAHIVLGTKLLTRQAMIKPKQNQPQECEIK